MANATIAQATLPQLAPTITNVPVPPLKSGIQSLTFATATATGSAQHVTTVTNSMVQHGLPVISATAHLTSPGVARIVNAQATTTLMETIATRAPLIPKITPTTLHAFAMILSLGTDLNALFAKLVQSLTECAQHVNHQVTGTALLA